MVDSLRNKNYLVTFIIKQCYSVMINVVLHVHVCGCVQWFIPIINSDFTKLICFIVCFLSIFQKFFIIIYFSELLDRLIIV